MKIDSLNGLEIVDRLPGLDSRPKKSAGQDFAQALKKAVGAVDQDQKTAQLAIDDLAVGRTNRLHETIMASEEAEISMKLLLQVRNKAIEAYRELMRMSV